MSFSGSIKKSSRLSGAATSYFYLNYSVIPVYGDSDPQRAKVATINWSPYQQRRATPDVFEQWFDEAKFGGLALVTGRISRLLVLDFDDAALAADFATRYPQLTQTRTVHSAGRNLPHYYYHLPRGRTVNSQSATGVDLQAEGRYVLAPPTTLGDAAYTIERGGEPLMLSPAQICILQTFVTEQTAPSQQETADTTSIHAVAAPTVMSTDTAPDATQALSQAPVAPDEAVLLYRHAAQRAGRNKALFDTALRLRDSGWILADALACLTELHVQQRPVGSHRPETPSQRRREAQGTIRSAFSRAPRQRLQNASEQPVGLPNSVREAFLQRKEGYLVRVLDALFMAGVQAGDLVTEKQICQILDGQVGRYSVLKALKATYHDKSSVFSIYDAEDDPSPRPPSNTSVASANADNSTNKCLLVRATSPDKNTRGRPPRRYIMPRIETLCAKLDVRRTFSDPLQPDDVESMAKYRQGLEREFIKRAPGLYPRGWLAARLGVSKRTSQRYRQQLNLKQRPMYFRTYITWRNWRQVPEEAPRMGIFLQDEYGERYPPLQAVAKMLLAKGREVVLMHQDVNYYWSPDAPCSPLAMMGTHPRQIAREMHADVPPQRDFAPLDVPDPVNSAESHPLKPKNLHKHAKTPQRKPSHVVATSSQMASASAPEPYKPQPKRFYRQALPDENAEYYAMRLYRKTQHLCEVNAIDGGSLSKASARRLAHQYGAALVKRLLGVLQWRHGIENPAGFATIWLRSEHKREQDKTHTWM